jgi:acyl-CoA thioester hydrolase
VAELEPSSRRSVSTVRVRYAETDQMGVAYYANYFVWFEVARTDWLRQAGLTYRDMETEGILLPVIDARCEYRSPARYDDSLAVAAEARMVSPARLAFDYEITGAAGLVARGSTVQATMDRNGRPMRIPARVKALVG